MRVWPSAEALEERLAAELADGEARVLCDDDLTWDDLVDRVIAAAPAQAASEPIGDRLALRAACVRASDLGAVASSPGFLAGVARFVAEAERAGLAPVDVDQPRARRLMAILVEKRRLGRGASRDRRRDSARRIWARTHARSSRAANGFTRYSSAPASSPSIRDSSPARADRRITGTWLRNESARSSRMNVSPSIPGIMTSARTRSGRRARADWSAASPSATATTS